LALDANVQVPPAKRAIIDRSGDNLDVYKFMRSLGLNVRLFVRSAFSRTNKSIGHNCNRFGKAYQRPLPLGSNGIF
jgi:hypothetical protein